MDAIFLLFWTKPSNVSFDDTRRNLTEPLRPASPIRECAAVDALLPSILDKAFKGEL